MTGENDTACSSKSDEKDKVPEAETKKSYKPSRATGPRKFVAPFTPTFDKPRTRGKKINAEWVAQLMPSAYKLNKKSSDSSDEEEEKYKTPPLETEPKRKRGRPRKEIVQVEITEESKKRKIETSEETGAEDQEKATEKDIGEGGTGDETVIVFVEEKTKDNRVEVEEYEVNPDDDLSDEMEQSKSDKQDNAFEDDESDLHSDSIDIKQEVHVYKMNEGIPSQHSEMLDELSVNWPKCFLCEDQTETFEDHDEFALHVKEKHVVKDTKGATYVLCKEANCGRKTYVYKNGTKDIIRVIGQLLLHMMKVHGMKAPDYVIEHKCEHCDYTTVIQNALTAHNHFVHKHPRPEERATCPYCVPKIEPAKKKGPKVNVNNMRQPLEMRCFFCEDDHRYGSKMDYFNHFRQKHVALEEANQKKGTISCPTCFKKSPAFEVSRGCMIKLAALSIFHHMVRTHEKPIPYYLQTFKCDSCDYTTMLPRALRDHAKSHKGELCEQCGKELHYSMKEHKLYYCKNGPPPTEQRKGGGPCAECGMVFQNYVHLKAHVRKVHRAVV